MTNEVLELILKARDEASAGLKAVQSHLVGIAEKAHLGERAMHAFEAVLTGIGQGLGIAIFFKLEEIVSRLAEAIPHLIEQGMRFGETVHNLTELTGASAEEASRLLGIYGFLGISTDALGMRIGILSRNVIAHEDTLKALGVSIRDANGHIVNQIEILDRVRHALSQAQDGTAKLTIEQQIFGRRAADMVEFLNLTDVQVRLLREEMDRLGITMDEQGTLKAEAASKEFNLLGLAVQGVANRLINDVAPALISAVDAIARWIADNGAAIAAFAANVANFVLGVMTALTGATFATVTFTDALGRIPTLSNEARTNIDALTNATGSNTAAIDKNIARIDRQIKAIEERDRVQERAFTREMSRLQAELDSQLDAIDAAEQKQADLEAQARLTRELAAAERDLVAAQRGGDPQAIADARQRVVDIVQRQEDAGTKAGDDARRAQIRAVKDYVDAIAQAEKDWTSKKGLLEQLKRDEAIVNSAIAADRQRGDQQALADDQIRLEAVKSAEVRAQQAIRNQTQEDALAKEKSRLEELKSSIGSVIPAIKALIPPWLVVGETVKDTTAAGMNDMRHFGETVNGPGGITGAFEDARQAGIRFGRDVRKALGELADAVRTLAGLLGGLIDRINEAVLGLRFITDEKFRNEVRDKAQQLGGNPLVDAVGAALDLLGGLGDLGLWPGLGSQPLGSGGLIRKFLIPDHAEGGWAGLYGPETIRVGERGPERIIRAEDAPHGLSGRGGGFYGTIKVFLDGREVRGTISRILFEEERAYGGPIRAGSPF